MDVWYFKHSDWIAIYLSKSKIVLHSEMMDGVGFRFTVVREEEILRMLTFLKNIALSQKFVYANTIILCKSTYLEVTLHKKPKM